ncbi:hypothetical protein BC941DRAFT_412490 [Chlamydoabsidia padenii]|nr:hypothetical protein BC941DRAFT_412490 [Chlamydoabsidia padenii]
MCDILQNMHHQPENDVLSLQSNLMDDKNEKSHLIKLNSPVGTMVTVRLDAPLLGPYVYKLVLNEQVVEAKCVQIDGTACLTAIIPQQPVVTSMPIYLMLLSNDGSNVTTRLVTDYSLDSVKLESPPPCQRLDHQYPIYQSPPSAFTDVVDHYPTLLGSSQDGSFNDKYGPATFRPRILSMNDPYNDDDGITSTDKGFTNLLTSTFDPPTTFENPRDMVIQQPTYHNAMGSKLQPHHTYRFSVDDNIPNTTLADYQPYPGITSRTNLNIKGNLISMTENWTSHEKETQRRLVRFTHTQSDQAIQCTFHQITRNNINSNKKGTALSMDDGKKDPSIVVSCIHWPEQQEWYITSVDCLKLMECLMEIQFTVDEKNRMRRNLEGFRPLTVSKTKTDSAMFFKRIMSYTNPKPRNIEKDLKVFPWKSLPFALKKIITKYTTKGKPRRTPTPYCIHPDDTHSLHPSAPGQQQQQSVGF